MELPPLPVPTSQFVDCVNKFPQTQAAVADAVQPFKAFESKLREVYAQHPNHPAVTINHLVSVFDAAQLTVRARDLARETVAEKEMFLLPLRDAFRKTNGSPATVNTAKQFRTNFNIFSESSLVDLDWNNVVVAGSAVATCLLPVVAPHDESKRALRRYYHEELAPASDVDLFLYGLDEEHAIEKIKQIETSIRDSILAETTTVRTKNAITIVSQYPTRHVQIVLRLYKNISEVLTGFDVDCSCVAYDGQNVWASPRALAAFMTQTNCLDLTRRSPPYENRLSKYSHRGFEVYWPAIERDRIDPTIFERSFSRVQGLARLLVLEKLPHPDDRDKYLAQLREERGRPRLPWRANFHQLPGNVKDVQPDDVAEWFVEPEEVSNYNTLTIPYGPRYHAKKIEKLLFTKDLLLNAEWNRPKDRKTILHRHPAFFGSTNDVIHDCCGFCPQPDSDADFAALDEEGHRYISGDIAFLRDDPGRQAIGSFNPITARTGQRWPIVDQDLEAVRDWFSSPMVTDINRRDHTGRTPLHLAAMCSTSGIVQCLIEHGARLTARLYNGMTALHIAAHRGEVQMLDDLLEKSIANERERLSKEEAQKEARRAVIADAMETEDAKDDESESFDADEDMTDEDEAHERMTEGSFVKVGDIEPNPDPSTENKDDPDVYDVDVLAWDAPLSPLHLAILGGHGNIIDVLVNKYDADIQLPVKILESFHDGRPFWTQTRWRNARAAILSIVLAFQLPLEQANRTVKTLFEHGATCTQADKDHISALHYAVSNANILILETLQNTSATDFYEACRIVSVSGHEPTLDVESPLITAIRTRKMEVVNILLAAGLKPHIDFEAFADGLYRRGNNIPNDPEAFQKLYQRQVEQPLVVALNMGMVGLVNQFLDQGEDVNTLSKAAQSFVHVYWSTPESFLDAVRNHIKILEQYLETTFDARPEKPTGLEEDEKYLDYQPESYQYWTAYHDLREAKRAYGYQVEEYERELASPKKYSEPGSREKEFAVRKTLSELVALELRLVENGAKTFDELYPQRTKEGGRDRRLRQQEWQHNEKNVPYQTKISFKVADLNADKKGKYLRLFEAAWIGDGETVKSLCMTGSRPLQVAVTDLRGFSPYAISVLRGHLEVAKLVVQIATIQYLPDEESERYDYTIQLDGSNDGDLDRGNEQGLERNSEINVLAQLVDETFTVNDVLAVASSSTSKISPPTMVTWKCKGARALDEHIEEREASLAFVGGWHAEPQNSVFTQGRSVPSLVWFQECLAYINDGGQQSLMRYAIFTNDLHLLKFLIKTQNDLVIQKDETSLRVSDIEKEDFELALRLGRVELIDEIIKTTGFALPLETLVDSSKATVDEKPRYYQGLTVHSRKRQDWADAGRGYRGTKVGNDIGVPLLRAILHGNVQSTKYFLSDAPLRGYLQFADSCKNDKRIKALMQAERVLDYLLHQMPHALENRSAHGMTPLQVAYEARRYHAARKLIAAGANQATKDEAGRNVLHSIFRSSHFDRTNPALLRSVLRILDQDVATSLLLERSKGIATTVFRDRGQTPLGLFVEGVEGPNGWQDSLQILLSLSLGRDLEIMDTSGDYLIHNLIRDGQKDIVRFLVEFKPELLHWENATGMVPLEVAFANYSRDLIDMGPKFVGDRVRYNQDDIINHITTDIDGDDDHPRRNREWRKYRLVESLVAKYPGKRKLVGLQEANEVAKRLARHERQETEDTRRRKALGMPLSKPRSDHKEKDEVARRISRTSRLHFHVDRWDELVWRKNEAGEENIEHEYKDSHWLSWDF
ncbi:hypothetical protein EDD37DRAFT_679231 [Exophiala viscosa]|uniref:uncharacterized protein n=1 Tax=Exophiala viscosa TaxID=2486360 RepID=UPI0021955776|nr:hypothetical protein EDD37DRAFT_679231 [Exophiala viscosa]